MIRFLFQLKAYTALRARLAALLVVALLATGIFGMGISLSTSYPTGSMRLPTGPSIARVAKPNEFMLRTGYRSESDQSGRYRNVVGSPPDFEQAHADELTSGWVDTDRDLPRRPRFAILKLPADEDAEGDRRAPRRPALSYASRAPPSRA